MILYVAKCQLKTHQAKVLNSISLIKRKKENVRKSNHSVERNNFITFLKKCLRLKFSHIQRLNHNFLRGLSTEFSFFNVSNNQGSLESNLEIAFFLNISFSEWPKCVIKFLTILTLIRKFLSHLKNRCTRSMHLNKSHGSSISNYKIFTYPIL